MANNEEKIYLLKVGEEEPCSHCKWEGAFSRAEAVERIAKALCQLSKKTEDCRLCSICWEEGCNLCDFDAFAEAALDALLGKEARNAIH